MNALQESFRTAFTSIISVGEGGSTSGNSRVFEESQMAIHELGQMIHAADSVIKYTSWIFNLTTAAFGFCALSLVCFPLVSFIKV